MADKTYSDSSVLVEPEADMRDIELNVSDRCDVCGAQARAIVFTDRSDDDKKLYFCAHHFFKHEKNFYAADYRIHDETTNLYGKARNGMKEHQAKTVQAINSAVNGD